MHTLLRLGAPQTSLGGFGARSEGVSKPSPLRGTEGSNPAPSSGESRKLQLIGEGSDEEITAEPDRAVQCDATDARRPVDLAPTDRPGRQFEILAASGRKPRLRQSRCGREDSRRTVSRVVCSAREVAIEPLGTVSLTCCEQNEPDARCTLTRPRPHLAIGSPPRRGISAASSGRRGLPHYVSRQAAVFAVMLTRGYSGT